MPDFAGERNRSSRGKVGHSRVRIVPPSSGRTAAKASSPLKSFRRLLDDFKTGIDLLRSLPKTDSFAGSKSSRSSFYPTSTLGGAKSANERFSSVRAPQTLRDFPSGIAFAKPPLLGLFDARISSTEKRSPTVAAWRPRTPFPRRSTEDRRSPSVGVHFRGRDFVSPSAGRSEKSAIFSPRSVEFGKSVSISSAGDRFEESAVSPIIGVESGKGDFVLPSRIAAATGADREAIRHVREPYRGKFRQFPAAARIAQILRADSVLSSAGGRPNAKISAWAAAVKEGRAREIADLPSDEVEKVLGDAFGGFDKAQRILYVPSVHAMVERHRYAVRMTQERAESADRRIALARERKGGRRTKIFRSEATKSGTEFRSGSSVSSSPPSGSGFAARSFSGSSVSAGRRGNLEGAERESLVRTMFMNNDFGHLPFAAADLTEAAETAEKEFAAKPEVALSSDRRTGKNRAGYVKEPKLPGFSSEGTSAPKAPSSSVGLPAASTRTEAAKPSQQRISGQLTLTTRDGMTIGTADLEGSLT